MRLDVVAILESRDWWQPVHCPPGCTEAAALDFYTACAESLVEAKKKPDGAALGGIGFLKTPARMGFADSLRHWRKAAQDKENPLDWLRRTIGGRYKHGNLNRSKIVGEFPWSKTASPKPGEVVSFFYDAKGKKTLPFWDKFPLIIFLEKQDGSFLGLNIHYLPPLLRQRFFTELKKRKTGNRIKISYGDMKGNQALRYYKPCIKRYLDSHVMSPFARVSSNYWTRSYFCPSPSSRRQA